MMDLSAEISPRTYSASHESLNAIGAPIDARNLRAPDETDRALPDGEYAPHLPTLRGAHRESGSRLSLLTRPHVQDFFQHRLGLDRGPLQCDLPVRQCTASPPSPHRIHTKPYLHTPSP